jgi:hypothetical protein
MKRATSAIPALTITTESEVIVIMKSVRLARAASLPDTRISLKNSAIALNSSSIFVTPFFEERGVFKDDGRDQMLKS